MYGCVCMCNVIQHSVCSLIWTPYMHLHVSCVLICNVSDVCTFGGWSSVANVGVGWPVCAITWNHCGHTFSSHSAAVGTCVCVHVCLLVYVCVCACVFTFLCMYVCMCIYLFMCVLCSVITWTYMCHSCEEDAH